MSFRLLLGTFPRLARPPLSRPLSSSATRRPTFRLSALGVASGFSVASYWWLKDQPFIHADTTVDKEKPKHDQPLSNLMRAYFVYAMCSIPPLVDWSPAILSTLAAVPIVSDITQAFVRVTFFNQFVGGETAEGAIPLVEQLRSENKGCLFAYSVEVDEKAAAGKAAGKGSNVPQAHKQGVQEMIHSIDIAADFEDKHLPAGTSKGRRTWVAVKLVRQTYFYAFFVHSLLCDRQLCSRTTNL